VNLETIRLFFLDCTIVDYVLLILWSGIFIFAHDSYQVFNETLFRRKIEHFDTLHYSGMALFKLGIILFNLAPWLALTFVGR